MTDPAPLPERLRLRVVALVSAVLPSVVPVPAPLRKVAGFAPARRARLGGAAIWDALADDDFRAARGRPGGRTCPPCRGRGPGRHRGSRLAGARRGLGVRRRRGRSARWARTSARDDRTAPSSPGWPRRWPRSRPSWRSLRAEHRDELDRARADHKVLRQRLGEARGVLRAAEQERDAAHAARDEAVAAAEAATRTAEADVRRLRTQLEEAEAGLAATRRDTRSERDAATHPGPPAARRGGRVRDRAAPRARPPCRERSARRRRGGRPGRHRGRSVLQRPRDPGAAGADARPARARLIVDGYNVTKQAWPTASLEAQRSRLVAALGPVVARSGAETTVVFDAAESTVRTVMPAPRGVRVVFSPEGVIADDVIRQLVAAEPRGRVVVVVSGDQARGPRRRTRRGARSVPALG